MIYTDLYLNDLKKNNFDINQLIYSNICISGGTGLIGSYLIDYLLSNLKYKGKIFALVRNVDIARSRFNLFNSDERLVLLPYDMKSPIRIDDKIDFVVHAASLTDPINYSKFPVETMKVNIFGLTYLLDFCASKNSRFLFLSSCEVYGENNHENLKENDYGFIDILNPRASYNEAKRCCETYCAAYKHEYNIDVKVLRLSRVYGPTMKMTDSKALSQFIKNSLRKENIVLKSLGNQLFNYTYVSDVIGAIIRVLSIKDNSDLNISFNFSNTELHSLKEISNFIASLSGTKVIFENPTSLEKAGYSKSIVSSMDCSLFKKIFGFSAEISIFEGIKRTLDVLRSQNF